MFPQCCITRKAVFTALLFVLFALTQAIYAFNFGIEEIETPDIRVGYETSGDIRTDLWIENGTSVPYEVITARSDVNKGTNKGTQIRGQNKGTNKGTGTIFNA
jgi:hypothetical protein